MYPNIFLAGQCNFYILAHKNIDSHVKKAHNSAKRACRVEVWGVSPRYNVGRKNFSGCQIVSFGAGTLVQNTYHHRNLRVSSQGLKAPWSHDNPI